MSLRTGVSAAAPRGQTLIHWIIIHWFELSALALLCLNAWFVLQVLRVLRAVRGALILLGRYVDEARDLSKLKAR